MARSWRPWRTAILVLLLPVFVLLAASCRLLHRREAPPVTTADAARPAEPTPAPSVTAGPAADESAEARAAELVVAMVFARDHEERLARARELLLLQSRLAPARTPGAREARAWLRSWLDPADERERRQGRLGPRVGVRDVWHTPGYEVWIEAGDGLLVLDRQGDLLGRVSAGTGGRLHGIAFHDVDDDGQEEIFLEVDSGTNAGNRYVEILGWKEVGGAWRQVLARRLHATAFRWLDAGLGARLALVRLSGQPYVVIDPENEPEFLRWDEARQGFVTEAAPARKARVF